MAPAAGAWRARPFGGALQDLEVDFAQADRPALITAALRCCVATDGEDVWGWTLDRRVRALLAVIRAGAGDRLTWPARCLEGTCGREMELELSVEQLLSTPEPAAEFCCSPAPEQMLELRLATGADQRRWRATAEPGGHDLVSVLATSLVRAVNGEHPPPGWMLPREWLPGLDAAFGEHDPLGSLELRVACPWCGAQSLLEPDLEALALSYLALEQRRVLEQVHQLARAYHWTEAQVLAVPPRRRALYLARACGETAP